MHELAPVHIELVLILMDKTSTMVADLVRQRVGMVFQTQTISQHEH